MSLYKMKKMEAASLEEKIILSEEYGKCSKILNTFFQSFRK